MPDLRLIRADALKLRRRPGMLAISILGTLGPVLVAFIVTALQHSGDPAKHGPAGGLHNYQDAMAVVGALVLIMGAIVGATAGSQDLESGVFRDLAATGRSRVSLFTARVAGAWVIAVPIAVLVAAVTAAASVALAGSLAGPGAGAIATGTVMVAAAAALTTALAVGLSAVVGSRGPVIGILLGFLLAVQPLLQGMSLLGKGRELVPATALNRIGDLPPTGVSPALGVAVLVVLGWAALAIGAGAWRTVSREI